MLVIMVLATSALTDNLTAVLSIISIVILN
jgi:hypothetical protein